MRNKSTPKNNIFAPVKIFLAILVMALFFFAPVAYPDKDRSIQEQNILREFPLSLNPFASSADACPWNCIKCTSWDPDAWPRTCLTYECMDANGGCGDPGDGGGGGPVYQPPTISHVLNCSNMGTNGWCIGTLSLDLSASDPQGQSLVISGTVNGVAFTCPSGQTTCSIPLPEAAGTATYKVDSATGLSANGSTSYQLDVTTPQINGGVNGTAGFNGWYVSDTLVTASATDTLSGMATLEVNVDNAGWVSYSDTTFTDGVHTIQMRATDLAGNFTEVQQTVMVDTLPPSLAASGQLLITSPLSYRLADLTSGLSQLTIRIADKNQLQPDSVSSFALSGNNIDSAFYWDGMFTTDHVQVGWYPFVVTVTDMAGNQSSQSGAYEVNRGSLLILGYVQPKEDKSSSSTTTSGSFAYAGGISLGSSVTAPTEEVFMEETISPEEPTQQTLPSPVIAKTNLFQGVTGHASFSSGSQTTSSPVSNPNLLWGAAATAMLGATLAEWTKKREEEAARLAALRNSGGGEEEEPSGRKNPGRVAYEKMMQQKRIVGESQALLNQNRAREQAMQDYRAGEKNAVAMNTGGGKPLAMPVPVVNQVTDKEREDAMNAYRDGERNAVAIAEGYKSQVREEAKDSYRDGERNAVSIAEEYKARVREEAQQSHRDGERNAMDTVREYAEQSHREGERVADLSEIACIIEPEKPKKWWQVVGDWVKDHADNIVTLKNAADDADAVKHVVFTPQNNNRVSVSAPDLPQGTRLEYFSDDVLNKFDLPPGGNYSPSTITTRTTTGLIDDAVKGSSIPIAGVTSLVTNMYEYGNDAENWDEFYDKTFEKQEFWTSTVVDTTLSVLIGLAAAGLVALFITATTPLWATVLAVAGVSVVISILVGSSGLPETLDSNANMFIDDLQGE